jgi:hypothetical protein
MSHQPPNPGLRASDADREETITRLHRAATEGRLDADELEERIASAYAAKHCTQLEALTADVTPPAPRSPAPWSGAPVFIAPVRRTSTLAIASLLCAVIWGWWVGSVAAVLLGHAALRQIAASGGRRSGRGLAVAGMLIGYVSLLIAVGVLFLGGFH